MSILDLILGRRKDPTREWGKTISELPEYDLEQMRFGTLRFGDPINAASSLGRPEQFQFIQAEYCELIYASLGFQIDFEEGRLACILFFIGPDEFQPKDPKLRFSKPRVRGCLSKNVQLSEAVDRSELERMFGSPKSVDVDDDETILFYELRGTTMEFEFDGKTGRLKLWKLFPTQG